MEHAKARQQAMLDAPPSGKIRLALADLEAIENTPGCAIEMALFRYQPEDGICYHCLGGAVLANRFDGMERDGWYNAWRTPHIKNIALAMDNFRYGDIREALEYLGIGELERGTVTKTFPITPHRQNAKTFKRDMHAMADYLESVGL